MMKVKRKNKRKNHAKTQRHKEKRLKVSPSLREKTRRHYDSYPFDIGFSSNIEHLMDKRLLGELLDKGFLRGKSVADIGCGVGRVLRYLALQGGCEQLIGADLSIASLRRIAKDSAHSLVNADNLHLPFKDFAFDMVISIGVIHHTPDARAAFDELCRIVKPGGHIYLSVYHRYGLYYYLFNTLGKLCCWLDRTTRGRLILQYIFLPIYYLLVFLPMMLISTGSIKYGMDKAMNLFADQYLTPQAVFHTKGQIMDWAQEKRLRLLEFRREMGLKTITFLFVKSVE